MLNANEKAALYSSLVKEATQAGKNGIDSRLLISTIILSLQSIPSLNRHHVSGMLAHLKRNGLNFNVIQPGSKTIVYY